MPNPEDIFFNVPNQMAPDGLGPGVGPFSPETWTPPPTAYQLAVIAEQQAAAALEAQRIRNQQNNKTRINIMGVNLRWTLPKVGNEDGSGSTEVSNPVLEPATQPTHTSPDLFRPITKPELRPEDPRPTPTPNPSPPDVIISPTPDGKSPRKTFGRGVYPSL